MPITAFSRRWALAAALVVPLTACGSTAQVSGSTSPDGVSLPGTTGGTTLPGQGTAGGTTGVTPGAGSTSGGTGGVGSTGAQPPPAGTSGGSSTTGGVVGRGTPGVTSTQVRVGMVYLANGDQAAKSVGVNLSRGDEKRNAEAVVAEVNARGGLAGRKVVPVYYAYDAQSTQPIATQEQAACAHFTQDNRVFVVVANGSPDFTECLNRRGVLHVTTGNYIGFDRAFYRRYPTYFGQRPSQDRTQADLVAALVRQKYFGGWDAFRGAPGTTRAKVGVLVIDRPDYLGPLSQVLLPALRRAGYPVDPTLVYRAPLTPSAQEAGPGAAATKSAVLRFQQAGVTHVVVLDANGSTTLLFAQNASSQLYFPRLGVTSASGIQQLYDLGTLDARQVNGAMGLGWTPTLDLPAGMADPYLSKAAPECLAVMKRRTGQTYASTTAAGVALFACDSVFPLATALKGLRGPLTAATAVRAIESVGSSLLAAAVPKLYFSPAQHDGLATAFDMAWDSACGCAQYRDRGHRMP